MLWHRGEPQRIRRKAFDVLLLLIEQRPQTLSHERIAHEVWGRKVMPTKHVARAVMDARRHIGDDPEAPSFILSVRGIGYRFAADVAYADHTQEPQSDGADDAALTARADIEAAAACLRRGDFDEAGRLADRAISTADLAGAQPELTRGLALAAVVLLRVGSHDQALALATRAMRLAQRDGRSPLIADARLALAEVQLWMGSAHAALDHLLDVHRVLAVDGPSMALWRCEGMLGQTYREIGRLDEAWPWCERAEALALKLDPETRAMRERLVKVAVLHYMIEADEADDREGDLIAHGLQALALLDIVEADASSVGSIAFERVCMSYRAITLEAMNRVAEGWAVLERLRPVLFGPDTVSTPWLEFRRKEFRQVEAGLLSRSGRHAEALEAIDTAMAEAPTLADTPMEPISVQGLAARICERAGRYQDALLWMRRQHQSVCKLHADRAQATAGIVRAQLESDRLGDDLAEARAEVERLAALNRTLQQRMVQMERHALLDEGGLVPAAALAATIDGRAALARERELPLCIGIVECEVGAADNSDRATLLMRRRTKQLSATLKAMFPEASAVAQWQPGVFFFLIADLGLGPSRQRCLALAQRLNAEAVPTTTPEAQPSYRAHALDITRFRDIEAALGPHRPSR